MTQYMDGPQGLFKTYQKDVFNVISLKLFFQKIRLFSTTNGTKNLEKKLKSLRTFLWVLLKLLHFVEA